MQRQEWPEVNRCEPIEEMALYGGMVRLSTGEGEGSQWREDKALKVNNQVELAYFKDNEGLLSWVKAQAKKEKVVCLGEGYDGVWNLYPRIATAQQR